MKYSFSFNWTSNNLIFPPMVQTSKPKYLMAHHSFPFYSHQPVKPRGAKRCVWRTQQPLCRSETVLQPASRISPAKTILSPLISRSAALTVSSGNKWCQFWQVLKIQMSQAGKGCLILYVLDFQVSRKLQHPYHGEEEVPVLLQHHLFKLWWW